MPQPRKPALNLNRFEDLRHRLIDAGLPPRRARRVTRELADHHADIVAERMAEGFPRHEAVVAADLRLGGQEELYAEILAKDPRRSIIKRYPALVFPLGPLALAAAIFAVSLFALIQATDRLKALGLASPGTVMDVATVHYYVADYLLLPALSVYVCWTAYRHQMAWYWPLLGIAALALVGGLLLDLHLTLSVAGKPGSGEYQVGFHMVNSFDIKSWWRSLSPLAVFGAYLWWSRGLALPRGPAGRLTSP